MTKTKFALIGAVVVAAFAAVVVVEHQSIATLRQDNQALREQVEQIAPLQAENERLSNAIASAGASTAQDSPVRELARLRGEVGLLRENVAKLRQQTNRMAGLQEENQRLHSGIAAAQAASTRIRAAQPELDPALKAQYACINNLRLIDSAKQQWALEQRKQVTDTPEWSDLQPYLGRGPNRELPVCPSGGAYTIGSVGEPPKCATPGHVLP